MPKYTNTTKRNIVLGINGMGEMVLSNVYLRFISNSRLINKKYYTAGSKFGDGEIDNGN
jgi:hypothetical protein